MPGVCPGEGGMLKLRFDRYITVSEKYKVEIIMRLMVMIMMMMMTIVIITQKIMLKLVRNCKG